MSKVVNKKEVSASLAGNISLGGGLSVHRLGFGAMRITGEGIWGPPKDRKVSVAVLRRAVELGVNFIELLSSHGIRLGWAESPPKYSLGSRKRTRARPPR